MNPLPDEPARPRDSHLIARLQDSLGALLLHTLTGKFAMPPDEAETLLYGLLLSARDAEVRDPAAWLIRATCASAHEWRRSRALDAGTPEDAMHDILRLRGIVFTRKALEAIPDRGRTALRLRYQYRWSFADIGEELGVTTKYAEILVMRAMRRLRESRRAQR
jgi:DNA-directed RNA polymerase specialized sigma24 family protein